MVSGSSFFLRPTYDAAKNINVIIDDPRKIAASASAATVPGDNQVALKLAGLENQSVLNSGTDTITDAYGQLISDVGSKTHSAQIGRTAQETLLNQAQGSRENISVASSLFDTLIGAVR